MYNSPSNAPGSFGFSPGDISAACGGAGAIASPDSANLDQGAHNQIGVAQGPSSLDGGIAICSGTAREVEQVDAGRSAPSASPVTSVQGQQQEGKKRNHVTIDSSFKDMCKAAKRRSAAGNIQFITRINCFHIPPVAHSLLECSCCICTSSWKDGS